jgi:hypothetical protein
MGIRGFDESDVSCCVLLFPHGREQEVRKVKERRTERRYFIKK